MPLLRAVGLVLALTGLAAAGAAAALLLLSTIGAAPDDDPVGRLNPVVPGLIVGATGAAGTGSVSTDDPGDQPTDDTGDDATTADDHRHGGDGSTDERDDD